MNSLASEFTQITIGTPVTFHHLTLFPLLRSRNTEPPDYLLLEDAIAQDLARVTELTASGSVPELRFENKSDQPVLLLDGEELVGAKQNRVLNVTVLAPPRQTILIPVSCVEASRWHMQAPEFKTAEHVLYSLARANRTAHVTASMRDSGTRRSNQSALWNDIAEKSSRMKATSPTRAMSAVYKKHALSINEYVDAFDCDALQAGVLFVIPGHCMGVDLFDHPTTLHRLFPKLVRSYALDALEASGTAPSTGDLADIAKKIPGKIVAAPSFAQRAIGMGEEVRIDSPSLSGAALWALDRYVHMCAFVPDGEQKNAEPQTRIGRPSGRFSRRTSVH
jgi:hypothetical protein